MRTRACSILAGILVIAVGCASSRDDAGDEPTAPGSTVRATVDVAGTTGPIVTGAGHVLRDLGGGPELTTFAFNAGRNGTGSVGGHFAYHFRAGEFSMLGRVTCATVVGSRSWIGGVIDKVMSDDPADQSFVATDVWWLVEDNTSGGSGTPDRTTSLLLTLPGTTITAESWCRDQPANPLLPIRPLAAGNIDIHD